MISSKNNKSYITFRALPGISHQFSLVQKFLRSFSMVPYSNFSRICCRKLNATTCSNFHRYYLNIFLEAIPGFPSEIFQLISTLADLSKIPRKSLKGCSTVFKTKTRLGIYQEILQEFFQDLGQIFQLFFESFSYELSQEFVHCFYNESLQKFSSNYVRNCKRNSYRDYSINSTSRNLSCSSSNDYSCSSSNHFSSNFSSKITLILQNLI